MRTVQFIKKACPLLFLLLLIWGCGGGGSGGSAASGEEPFRSVEVAWDPPDTRQNGTALSSGEIGGYRVHYGAESGNYDTIIDVGGATSLTIEDVPSDCDIYVAVTVYDTDGLESNFSDELVIAAE
ncbi:MAG: fibronectin type III domain-containing protein [Candidatus Methylomirabilis sp.]|nr:fibronectin type III domain-containing protein [Deltaproteobacteria bacterium]